jgi:hypothetical protein
MKRKKIGHWGILFIMAMVLPTIASGQGSGGCRFGCSPPDAVSVIWDLHGHNNPNKPPQNLLGNGEMDVDVYCDKPGNTNPQCIENGSSSNRVTVLGVPFAIDEASLDENGNYLFYIFAHNRYRYGMQDYIKVCPGTKEGYVVNVIALRTSASRGANSPQDKLQVASEHTWSSKINKDCTPAVGKLPDAGDCSIQDGKGKPISCDPTLDPRDYTP